MTPEERQRIRDSIALALAVKSRHPSAQAFVRAADVSPAPEVSDGPRRPARRRGHHLRIVPPAAAE